MDLLYTGRFSGFCIVSSDSDFARLAVRIREQGVTVFGFGERKPPRPFITACDQFVYVDVLGGAETPKTKPIEKPAKAAAKPAPVEAGIPPSEQGRGGEWKTGQGCDRDAAQGRRSAI
nr:NYN domain-containing protein [Rhizobium laguerreae]